MRKIIPLLLLIVLVAVSCRPQPDLSRDFDEPETWGETFDIYWKKMSTNYLFWNLDYNEGRDWDKVYDEYKGRFDELGLVEDNTRTSAEQKANTLTAYRYFFDIIKHLSDGHYALQMDDQCDNTITLAPYMYRYLTALDYTEEEIFTFFADPESRKTSLFNRYQDYNNENTVHIMEYSFGLPTTGSGTAGTNSYGFLSMQYVNISKSTNTNEFHIALGRNSDGIVYFAFSGFNFYPYITAALISGENEVSEIIQEFFRLVTDENTTGVVIDLRGNSGGVVSDMAILWTAFMPEGADSLRIGDTRRKNSENRTDYTVWSPFIIERCNLFEYGTFNDDVPIAIILNENSVSCAEMSTFAFMSLRDTYGYNVRLFGAHSQGGNGALITDSESKLSEILFNGGITTVAPYITLVYTPYCQSRYINGTNYEGKGIPVDEQVTFSPSDFKTGNDLRLKAALAWLEEQNQN